MKFSHQLFVLGLLCLSPTITQSATNESAALHLDWLDKNIQPRDNFYLYANQNWKQKNPIPPQYAAWGTFSILQENSQKIIHKILINAANDRSAKPGSIEQKVGDFYFSGMDEESINKLGLQPLKPEFERIDAIKNLSDLKKEISHLHQIGVGACFDFESMQDFKNSKEMIGAAVQDGLSLPDRDYYLNKNEKFNQIRKDYVAYMIRMFQLAGDSSEKATAQAKVVMDIETMLATASMSQIEQRDPHAIYHLMNLTQLDKITPNFSWGQYFKDMGYPQIEYINLAMPNFS